ncbi:CREC-EF hand family protein [Gimesia benthica]|nr:hypothetical protein [Gimesia benthica]
MNNRLNAQSSKDLTVINSNAFRVLFQSLLLLTACVAFENVPHLPAQSPPVSPKTTKQSVEKYSVEFKKRDTDKNGQLTPVEYLGKKKGQQRQKAKREFYDWDINSDQQLSLQEFSRREKPKQQVPLNEFRYRDADGDQRLSQAEYLAPVAIKFQPSLIRDFALFDLDGDQQLTFDEYQSIVSRDQRKLPHPLMEHVIRRMQDLESAWDKWDTNKDSKLGQDEFKASNLTSSIPGLELSKWEDWDRNKDGFVDQQETQQVLGIAYGLRFPTGELQWAPSGMMVSGMLFDDHVDKNGDHLIDLAEAKSAQHGFGDGKQTPALFKKMDQDGNGRLTMAEWKSDLKHWIDPVGDFLAADKDLDGHLNREELLQGTPSWQLEVTEYLFPGFDTNGDKLLSFREYRETPFANLALGWQFPRTDRDNDGYLSSTEFQWNKGLFGATLAMEYFQRFDINQDGKLGLNEFPFNTSKHTPEYFAYEFRKQDADKNGQLTPVEYLGKKKGQQRQKAKREFYDWDINSDQQLSLQEFSQRQKPKQAVPLNEFRYRDADGDQRLSQAEYLAPVAKKFQPRLIRDFALFDLDGDQQLTFDEYQSIVSRDQRKLPHPLMGRVSKRMQGLKADWSKWDTNKDAKLNQDEFKASKLTSSIPGLEMSKWEDWDRNKDGFVDQQETQQVLEIAYGLRYTTGEQLWAPSGLMLLGMLFDVVDLNGDHLIDMAEAKSAQHGFGDGKQTPALFKKMDQDDSGTLTMAEWKSDITHWIDPVGTFLAADKDLDGHLNREELLLGTPSWQLEVTKYLFPGCDTDGDKRLSFREYRKTPFANLALPWQFLRTDRDQDGYLSSSEFQWDKGLFAAALAIEYFQRFDINQNGKLELKEFPFNTSQRTPEFYAHEFKKRDVDKNGQLTPVEYLEKKKGQQRQQAKREFYDWDKNSDQQLSLQEFSQRQKPKQQIPLNEFRYRDADGDQRLSQAEYLAPVAKKFQPRLIRDFALFDLDGDQQLTFNEYQSIVSRDQRKLPHPLMERVAERMQGLKAGWSKWDTNNDAKLDQNEFKASNLTSSIPGLGLSKWEDWDRNKDGFVDQQETQQVLEIAYGLRYPTGELLWAPSGLMLFGMLFDIIDLNGDHVIDLAEAKSAKHRFGDPKQFPALFKKIDQDDNDTLTMVEWKSDLKHWTDPVGTFLAADKNLDGHLNREELLQGSPSYQLEVSEYLFPGFDTNGDKLLSFREYRETPFANPALPWQFLRTDSNQDGFLSISEFQLEKGLFGAALSMEYFQRFDINQDGKLDLNELPFNTSKRTPDFYAHEFKKRDVDKNGQLTSEEYLASIPENLQQRAIRDFGLFDLDSNQKLTLNEYQNIVSNDLRNLPHPLMERVAERIQELKAGWSKWDTNNDSKLDQDEFKISNFTRSIPGLTLSNWEDWDRNKDGFVDQQETQQVLEIAYGLRYPTGELQWAPSGLIVSGMLFNTVDINGDQLIDLKEAKLAPHGFGDGTQTPALFKQMDQDGNGTLTMAEWKSDISHWTNPVGTFLAADKDLDGHLTREELLQGTPYWQLVVTEYLFPGFDTNGDKLLSFREYRETPFANLALGWQFPRTDSDHDGYLSSSEFQWDKGLFAATLAKEYFKRFDINRDGKLGVDEFPFKLDLSKAPRGIVFMQRDSDQNGLISFKEVLGEFKMPPNPNETQKIQYETRLAHIEDAFRRADVNHDKSIDKTEFLSEAALEALAPHLVSKNRNLSSTLVPRSPGSKEADSDTGMWIILALNALLLVGVTIFLIRKTKISAR